MQEERLSQTSSATFTGLLLTNKRLILIILALGLALRMAFVIASPPAANDALSRYIRTANNILEGHGFTNDKSPPYLPGESIMPLYPLVVAGLYGLFGHHEMAVKIFQVFLDLITCLLVAFISFKLAPIRLKELAAKSALIIYGLCSWFTIVWTSYVLTETLAIFFTMLVVSLCVLAMERSRILWWATAGAACGFALLTRPDSLLLFGAVGLFLLIRLAQRRSWKVVWSGLSFCCAIVIVVAPWTLRNYVSLGKFQPLASEYGFSHGGYMPTGYLNWIRTWMIDETYFDIFNPAFNPGKHFLDPRVLPESAFDSAEERERVEALSARYNQTFYFTPDVSDGFEEIARERINRAPLRFFLVLPAERIVSVWVTGFSTSSPTRRLIRILSVLPIILGGVLGFALWCRRSPLAALLILIILTRTIFLGYHYAPETRYIVEAYPPMIASCGVTAAALWVYLRRRVRSASLFTS